MPRDLFNASKDEENPLTLTRSPESQNSASGSESHNDSVIQREESPQSNFQFRGRGRVNKEMDELHPYVQTLTIADLKSCVALENAAFPEHERCSPEKFLYRLSVCPELCLGLFSTLEPNTAGASAPTYPHARPPNSAYPSRKGVLIAHIIATKCDSTPVTDPSMDFPPEWQSSAPSPSETRGHQEQGRTIAVHSVAVLPAYHRRGIGKTLMKSYTQRMESSGIADRVSLLAHDSFTKFYELLGFSNKGPSDCKSYGGDWFNMIYEFSEHSLGF